MAKPYRARRWQVAQSDPAACWLLSHSLDITPLTAQILYNRGLTTPEEAGAFLAAGRDQILDPFLLKDMDKAVAEIQAQIAAGKPIMVYGDYDVDGVTATTVLVLALRALGADVEYYIPNRFSEGYGMNVSALEELHRRGHDFVISVDTGITAVEEAEAAKELGMTIVVSDHHEPGPEMPQVAALVNPKRPDCTYPFKGLSGVGVAFKIALALKSPNAWDLLDIVTLGTIADMVPLIGENRAIVREGLTALGATQRSGLQALMQVAGVKQPITATHVGFSLGPRINALGRMGSAMDGVELLITEDPIRAMELARRLDEENQKRRQVEAAITEEALAQVEQQSPEEKEYALVLAGEGWHQGVVGICASRVLEAYYRPTILLSIEGDEVKGSARSIPAFHMHKALLELSDLFSRFGGHAAAAGMTLKRREDIPVLRERLNRIAAERLQPEDLVPELRIDAYVDIDQINDELMAELQQLEPFGIGNPEPVLALRNAEVLDSRIIGRDGTHIKLTLLGKNGFSMEAVGWGLAPVQPPRGAKVQAAFFPEYNTYMGRRTLRLTLKDVTQDAPLAQPIPALTEEACLQWDPLADLGAGTAAETKVVADARGPARLAAVLEALVPTRQEVAATTEREELEEAPAPVSNRDTYLELLVSQPARRVLVLTASPWAAAGLLARWRAEQPSLREELRLWLPGKPEPTTGTVVIAAYGAAPQGSYTDTVLYHPPYHDGQIPSGPVHLLWEEEDWEVNLASLSWPYPDRPELVEVYKTLRAGSTAPESVARAFREMIGPWNSLRLHAGVQVFQEMGLADGQGRLMPANGVRFELETSERYRLGIQGRQLLEQLRGGCWPDRLNPL